MEHNMEIIINGEARQIEQNISISDLIQKLNLDPTQIAVEKNAAIVPKSAHHSTMLEAGDKLELVRFIGGG